MKNFRNWQLIEKIQAKKLKVDRNTKNKIKLTKAHNNITKMSNKI